MSVWVVWNLRGLEENKERSRLGMGGGGGDGESCVPGFAPLVGVPFDLGLAMLANLENGLFAVSLGGVASGVVARDWEW